MKIFTWDDHATIQKMHIQPYGKGKEAVLYAAPNLGKGELAAVAAELRSHGWNVVPDVEKGQHVIHVHGFDKEEEITATLEQKKFVSHAPQSSEHPDPEPKQKASPLQTLRAASLKVAGYAFLLGDGVLMAVGKLRGSNAEFRSGLAFTSTSIMLMRYGKKNVEKSFGQLHDKMVAKFASEGLNVKEYQEVEEKPNGRVARLTHSIKGLAISLDNFLYDHPTQVTCTINGYAGYSMAKAGMEMREYDKAAGNYKAIAGTLLAGGNVVSFLVPEKKEGQASKEAEKEKEKSTGPIQFIKDWVQEKPMRVTGYMAVINNFFQLGSALAERKGNRAAIDRFQLSGDAAGLQAAERSKHFWAFNLVAALSYMTGNGLLAISSKNANAANGHDPFAQIYSAAAAILINHPPEKRDILVNKMAFYLASQNEITRSAEEISQAMHAKLAEMESSPWISTSKPQIDTLSEEVAAAVEEKITTVPQRWADRALRTPDAVPAAWIEKENLRETARQEASLSGSARSLMQ